MAQSRVAERYAKALLDLANEKGQVAGVFGDVQSFINVLGQSRELEMLLNNPVVSASKKSSIFSKLFEGKMNPLTFGFMNLVLQKRRESDFGAIANSFVNLYNQQRGITKVKLTTAVPVGDAVLNEIVSKIKAANNFSQVEVEQSVDPSIIGGFVAEFNNKIMDKSVQSNLNQIKRRFSVN